MEKKELVLKQLSQIIDPDLGKDIVTLNFIKELKISDDGKVSFAIELTTPACPVKEQFRKDAERVVQELEWVTAVSVTMTAQKAVKRDGPNGLSRVKSIIAVASCKGGVGKSTVSVNLAYSLALSGAQVGLFDADVYGPSLPTMVQPLNPNLTMKKDLIMPIEHGGVQLMSFGFTQNARDAEAPAMMRGPMVSQVIHQLLTGTDWGELDYLVLDLPPGTGDIQLALGQLVSITASVLVTTPQHISFIDVVKGVRMFDTLNVPTVAVVENMSTFKCSNCDTAHPIFGTGAMKRLVDEFGFEHTFQLPIDPTLAPSCDSGVPHVIRHPNSETSKQFGALAEATIREVSKCLYGKKELPHVTFPTDGKIAYEVAGEDTILIDPKALRTHCRCAHCRDEMTDAPILDTSSIPDNLVPESISRVGNYAVGIEWSDGHSSLFPYSALADLACTLA